MSHFQTLNNINVNDRIEQKNGLKYLSWTYAWAEVKKLFPDATYHIHKFGANMLPYVFDPQTGYMVFTDVTIEGVTHEMWLPVMDGANKSMTDHAYTYKVGWGDKAKEKTCAAADMFDVNKTIMRCLVKNLAMFGLGLYVYSGEDMPEEEKAEQNAKATAKAMVNQRRARAVQFCKANGITSEQFNAALKFLQSDTKVPQGPIADMNDNDFDFIMGTLAEKAAKGQLKYE